MSRSPAGLRIASGLAAMLGCGALPTTSFGQPPSFEGTWSGYFTSQEHEYWNIEDVACFAGCPPEVRAEITRVLDDPANDERPTQELVNEASMAMRPVLAQKFTPAGLELLTAWTPGTDPVLECEPYPYARIATNPLPFIIRRDGENLVFQYEEWSAIRTIYMDGRSHPEEAEHTPLGYSIGHYDGDALVIETRNLSAGPFFNGGEYSDQAQGTERYTIEEDPRRLHLELTVEDPVMLKQPYVMIKTWLDMPELELVVDSCEDYPAQPEFENQ